MVSGRRLIYREQRNKCRTMSKFDTGYIVVVRDQVRSIRKDRVAQNILSKTKGFYRVMEKDTPK